MLIPNLLYWDSVYRELANLELFWCWCLGPVFIWANLLPSPQTIPVILKSKFFVYEAASWKLILVLLRVWSLPSGADFDKPWAFLCVNGALIEVGLQNKHLQICAVDVEVEKFQRKWAQDDGMYIFDILMSRRVRLLVTPSVTIFHNCYPIGYHIVMKLYALMNIAMLISMRIEDKSW